jgi:hypothetical protein
MPQLTIKPGQSVGLPPTLTGQVRTLVHNSGPAVAVGGQKMEGTVTEASRGLVAQLGVGATLAGLQGALSVYNAPGTVNAVVTYTDGSANAAGAIASPTSDTVGTKAAIDAIRAALTAAGITG